MTYHIGRVEGIAVVVKRVEDGRKGSDNEEDSDDEYNQQPTVKHTFWSHSFEIQHFYWIIGCYQAKLKPKLQLRLVIHIITVKQ